MLSVYRKALIKKFKNVTGVENVQLASSLLEASDWDVHRAISRYFDNPSEAIQVENRSKIRHI